MTNLEKRKKLTKYNFIVAFIHTIFLSISFVAFSEEADRDKAIEIDTVKKFIDNKKQIKKIIYIKDKLINIVIG